MIITTVYYRRTMPDGKAKVEKSMHRYSVVDGGIILHVSEMTDFFIPYSSIERIERMMSTDIEGDLRHQQSLFNQHRRR